MKKILLILVFLITGFGADGATRPSPRDKNTPQPALANTSARAARSATNARAARTPAATSPVQTKSTGTRTTTTIISAPSAARTNNAVVSRAAKQSVISTGTKVASATQNTVVDEKCWNGFMGCMDSFCMLDNANGGRCICSDKNAEYDSILAEIQSLDEQSYQMATVGVERIEMGDDANAIMKKTQEITKSIEKDSTQSKRKSLDLSAWNLTEVDFDADVEDIFSLASDGTAITNKTGDALYRAAAKLCNAQIPECKSQSTMMELMYKQRVRSDCTAYENSLRQQRTQSAQKLATAQSAMREAALEQYRSANKYDLGQCTVQFKQCMQTTGGCGDDFTGCVEYSVREGMVRGDKTGKTKTIKGTSSQIKLSAETYDVLESKKELCMSVTQQCVNVRDQVWDTFLREVAPQVKSAELIVESNKRTSCISNISACFQKACKDNMDPNDPDGSYDMCLTRPETLRSACKVEIDPCEGAIPNIMEYVTARLASMRVDSCTREFKQCLTSEDRCGADYTQCIGLDTDTIVEMCPRDKLVGCYNSKKPDADVYDELAEIATGIFLNIDNNMLTACQRAADAAMIKVCGSTTDCDNLIVDNGLGSRSLEYKICNYTGSGKNMSIDYNYCRTNIDQITDAELGRNEADIKSQSTGDINYTSKSREPLAAVLDGLIYWGSVDISNDGNIDLSKYFESVEKNDIAQSENTGHSQITTEQRQRISDELYALQTSVKNAISAIESDQMVQYCMTGREFQGYKGTLGTKNKVRFPNLIDQMKKTITASALSQMKENYYAKYDELNEKMLKDYSTLAERIADINKENNKDRRREIARQSCLWLSDMSTLPQSAEPPRNSFGKIAAMVAITGAVVAIPLTGGLSTATIPTLLGGTTTTTSLSTLGIVELSGAGAVAATGLLGNAGSGSANGEQSEFNPDKAALSASSELNQWNYKETITTTFDWENLVCHKCVRATKCEDTRNPLFGNKYCKEWGEETENCTDTQF